MMLSEYTGCKHTLEDLHGTAFAQYRLAVIIKSLHASTGLCQPAFNF